MQRAEAATSSGDPELDELLRARGAVERPELGERGFELGGRANRDDDRVIGVEVVVGDPQELLPGQRLDPAGKGVPGVVGESEDCQVG